MSYLLSLVYGTIYYVRRSVYCFCLPLSACHETSIDHRLSDAEEQKM